MFMTLAAFIPAGIFVVLVLLLITVSGSMNATGRSVDRVERKLDAVIEHLGIDADQAVGITQEALAEIDRCIRSDQRVRAVKLYREATDHGLLEAKNWVDRRAAAQD